MSHVNTLRLHQLRLGELSPDEAGQVRAHLADCALCAARAKHQQVNREAFLREPMPAALEPQPSWIERLRGWLFPAAVLVPATLAAVFVLRGPAPASPTLPAPPPAPREAAAVAAVDLAASETASTAPAPAPTPAPVAHPAPVAVVSSPGTPGTPLPAPEVAPPAPEAPVAAPEVAVADAALDPAADVTHSKGLQTRLEAWVQSGQSSRPLYLGETLGAGTRVQLRYDPQGRRFVTLAGRDSNGVVEVYGTVPAGSGGGMVSAPFALTLDDSHGEQTFFALCTNTRPAPAEVMAAVKHNPVRLEGAVVATVVVRKD